jgi:ABC-2 type transport system permease protein
MNRVATVFNQEFQRRVRSRPFVIGTALGAVSIILTTALPLALGSIAGGTKRVVLVGNPGLTATVRSLVEKDYTTVERLSSLPSQPTPAFLRAHHDASDVVEITRRADGLHLTVYARDPSAFGGAFARDIAPLQIALAAGLAVGDIKRHAAVPVDVHDVEGRFASVSSADAAKGVALLFIILLYVAILLNAQVIMSSVAEEKTSRIAELLVATLDPAQLLTAKVLASGATGLIQLGVWVMFGVASAGVLAALAPHVHAHALPGAPATVGSIDISAGEVLAFFAFFLIGFAQYSVLYAAAASLINRTEDLGTVAGPVLIPVVFGFLVAQFAVPFPNNPWIVVASQLPLLAPFVMFSRIAIADVPAWQIALSLVINAAAAGGLAWAAGRVYRVGLLLYGRPPTFRQVITALRA